MTLDAYTFWLFAAGALTGIALTIFASLIPDLPKVYRDYRDYFRSRKARKVASRR